MTQRCKIAARLNAKLQTRNCRSRHAARFVEIKSVQALDLDRVENAERKTGGGRAQLEQGFELGIEILAPGCRLRQPGPAQAFPDRAQQLHAARKHLEQYNVKFQPGVNEDLAATAIWGTQQLNLSPGARYDGVVGIWYGKGPGVDRCGDVFRHANAAGSAKHGGVLCLAGDDHGAKSSTVPHQSDHAFIAALMPYLYPSSIHEMIEMGLLGIAMSRYSGCWVGMKVITETVETTAEINLADEMKPFVIPTDFEMPPGGLNLRWPDDRYDQDRRLQDYKGFAAIAFARANKVNRITMDSPNARFGIMASGKSYEDVRQALFASKLVAYAQGMDMLAAAVSLTRDNISPDAKHPVAPMPGLAHRMTSLAILGASSPIPESYRQPCLHHLIELGLDVAKTLGI